MYLSLSISRPSYLKIHMYQHTHTHFSEPMYTIYMFEYSIYKCIVKIWTKTKQQKNTHKQFLPPSLGSDIIGEQ